MAQGDGLANVEWVKEYALAEGRLWLERKCRACNGSGWAPWTSHSDSGGDQGPRCGYCGGTGSIYVRVLPEREAKCLGKSTKSC